MSLISQRFSSHALLESPSQESGALAELLTRRRSVRDFSDIGLGKEEISQLCWAVQGITSKEGHRTSPSAGAIYPLTLLVVGADGVFEYLPKQHSLRLLREGDTRPKLQAAALEQPCVGEAPCCMVMAVDVDRMELKYGPHAERFCYLEAGHAAQNVLLMATELGLGCVPVGAFSDKSVASVLDLKPYVRPVYLLPIGHPLYAL